jgi:hypothetical protein
MKRLLLAVALLLTLGLPTSAQTGWIYFGGSAIGNGAALPSTCAIGQLFILTTTGVASTCTSTNTWTTLAGGGAVPSGASLPGTCTVGQLFVLTTTGVASTCTASNTWTAVGGGIGASGAALPGTCTVGQLFILTTTGVASTCTSTNTWTTLASGGGSGTVTATAGSLTARAVMLGAGGTDTRAVAGLGTSGQVLTSNGSSADPTFQAAGGGSSGGTAGPLSGWTGQNTGADWTAVDLNGGIGVTIAPGGANWRTLTKAVPSTPYIVSFHLHATLYTISSSPMSAGAYFSDGTKFYGIELYTTSGGVTLRVLKSNDVTGTGASVVTSISSAAGTLPYGMTSSDLYLQLGNDGTNLTFSWSLDGQLWTSLLTEGVGAFLTPTTYGFGGVNASLNTALIWMRDVTVAP